MKTLVSNHNEINAKKPCKKKKDQYEILCDALNDTSLEHWTYDLYSDKNGGHCICGKKIHYRFQIRKGQKTAFVGSECIQYFSRDLQEKILSVKSEKKYPLTKSEKELQKKIDGEKFEAEKNRFNGLIEELGYVPDYAKRKYKSAGDYSWISSKLIGQIRYEKENACK